MIKYKMINMENEQEIKEFTSLIPVQINEVISFDNGEVWHVVFVGRHLENNVEKMVCGVVTVKPESLVSFDESIENLENQLKDNETN